MNPNLKKGIIFALAAAVFSGFANFFNQFTVKFVGDPLVFTTLKNSLVVFFIFGLLIFLKKLPKIKKLSKKDLGLLAAIGIIGGSLPFYLFFTALSQMPVINASLIHKSLVIWVAILAVPILKEKLSKFQILAIIAVFSANLMAGGFKGFVFDRLELMVFAATILWAIENVIAKIALRRIDPDIVTGARMGVGSAVLLAAVFILGKSQMFFSLRPEQFALTFLATLILLCFVSFWYRALAFAPVILVATILTLATLITNSLSSVFITHQLTMYQILQFVLLIAGISLFIIAAQKFQTDSEKIQKRAIY